MGAVVLPCGQLCLKADGYPPLKLPVSSPAGLLCLPSRAIWMVNRDERLWEPNGVSLAPEPVASSCGIAPAFISSDFVSSFKREQLLWLFQTLFGVSCGRLACCFQWNLVDLGADPCPRFSFFFFFFPLPGKLSHWLRSDESPHHGAQGMSTMSIPST